MAVQCTHHDQIQKDIAPQSQGCEKCIAAGDPWNHLRLCMTCGHVGCCDASKNKHATKHYEETNHPIIKSLQTNEHWLWCYKDEVQMFEEEILKNNS